MWFTLTIILLSALCIILIRPSLFETDKETYTVNGANRNKPRQKGPTHKPTIKPAKPTNKWDGPKTDPRINKMLAESIINGKPLEITPEQAAEVIRIIETCHAENPLPVKF